jgi:hypothetical protein
MVASAPKDLRLPLSWELRVSRFSPICTGANGAISLGYYRKKATRLSALKTEVLNRTVSRYMEKHQKQRIG